IQNDDQFIKGVEGLIRPMEVSDLLFFQKLKVLMPPFLLRKMLYRASRNTPHIGFVIEPYSLFLFFKLKDLDRARAMLPDRYELTKTSLFAGEEPEHYMGLGNLQTRASSFWGTRQEAYLIARDKESGLLSFIFIDILSNTLIALPSKGIADPNCNRALFTTSARGEIFLEIEEKGTGRAFACSGSIKGGVLRELDQELWLMGNTSIGYSKRLSPTDDHPFAVIFDPAEVKEALDLPPENIRITKNNLFPGLAEETIRRVVCFPYAQHYIADSPGCTTTVTNRDDLIAQYNELAKAPPQRTFSARTIVRQIALGLALTALLVLLLSWLF
ncbi:MAG: hypothetical protein R2751_16270, partial [Bacteroidales bacterium]